MNPDTVVLSKHTIAILRSFSKIDHLFMFRPGNVLKMRSTPIYAEARVAETFPCEFPINLSLFLSGIAMYKQPHLLFVEGKHIRVTEPDGSSEAIYNFDPAVVAQVCSTKKKPPAPPLNRINFVITAAQLDMMRRGAKQVTRTTKFNMGFVSDGKRIAANYFAAGPNSEGQQQFFTVDSCEWPLKGNPCGIKCTVTLAKLYRWPLFKGGYRGTITEHYTTLTGLDVTYLIGHEPGLSWFGSQEPAKGRLEVV
jgi:hypothetical protein